MFLVAMLLLGVAMNLPWIVLTLIVLALFVFLHVPPTRAIAYSCFFCIGGAVAHFHWLILRGDLEAAELFQIATVTFVGVLCLTALLTSIRNLRNERLLQLLFLLSGILAVLQFSGVLSWDFVNWYARIYAVTCVVIPLAVLFRIWWVEQTSV